MFFKKKELAVAHTEVPTTDETEQVECIQLWRVTWESLHRSGYSARACAEREYEAFVLEESANKFAESLRAAMKLLRDDRGKVYVSKQEH